MLQTAIAHARVNIQLDVVIRRVTGAWYRLARRGMNMQQNRSAARPQRCRRKPQSASAFRSTRQHIGRRHARFRCHAGINRRQLRRRPAPRPSATCRGALRRSRFGSTCSGLIRCICRNRNTAKNTSDRHRENRFIHRSCFQETELQRHRGHREKEIFVILRAAKNLIGIKFLAALRTTPYNDRVLDSCFLPLPPAS